MPSVLLIPKSRGSGRCPLSLWLAHQRSVVLAFPVDLALTEQDLRDKDDPAAISRGVVVLASPVRIALARVVAKIDAATKVSWSRQPHVEALLEDRRDRRICRVKQHTFL